MSPINPGNSGGPLVDAGVARGVGFAVPVSTALATLARFQEMRGRNGFRLGLSGMPHPLGESIARQHRLSQPKGVLVLEVKANSPAAKASLRAQDIIVSMNGRAVGNIAHIRSALEPPTSGNSVEVQFLRGMRLGKTKVVL